MRYTFGDCRLDISSRELTRRGRPVHLSPKAFELLRVLVEERPRVVRKSELMNAVWPDAFVVEGNLPVLVAEVRDGLGSRASAASVIKTHHGIGYSFTADVEESRSTRDAGRRAGRVLLTIGERRIALGPGDNDVGRDPKCDVVIDDTSVSRRHARITVAGTTATLLDLGSKNGTRVKGAVARSAIELRDGDDVWFGSVQARFLVAPRRDPLSTLTR